MDATPETEPCVISLDGNTAVRVPLMACVTKTKAVAEAMARQDWDKAVELRGRSFQSKLNTYRMLTRHHPEHEVATADMPKPTGPFFNLACMCIGAPACGMNAAVRSFVRNAILNGHRPMGVNNGFDGLINNDIFEIGWGDVTGWVGLGGALLGCKRTTAKGNFEAIAENLADHKIHGLLLIGGFEAFMGALELYEARKDFPEFNIPIIVLPSTISNNVPGTDFSLGADTALNEITEICDRIRQSAQGTKRRVFIIETMGGYCGYLATMAGLAGGSDAAYIHEESFGIKDLMDDLEIMTRKMNHGRIERGLVLRNEKANENYTTDFISKLYQEEGKGIFTTRMNILGHMQQGGRPTPFDRNMGTKMAAKSFNWLVQQLNVDGVYDKDKETAFTKEKTSCCLLGLRARAYQYQPIANLKAETDFQFRRWKHVWWKQTRSIMRILAQHDSTYATESEIVKSPDEVAAL